MYKNKPLPVIFFTTPVLYHLNQKFTSTCQALVLMQFFNRMPRIEMNDILLKHLFGSKDTIDSILENANGLMTLPFVVPKLHQVQTIEDQIKHLQTENQEMERKYQELEKELLSIKAKTRPRQPCIVQKYIFLMYLEVFSVYECVHACSVWG
jgi:hypothetical protein